MENKVVRYKDGKCAKSKTNARYSSKRRCEAMDFTRAQNVWHEKQKMRCFRTEAIYKILSWKKTKIRKNKGKPLWWFWTVSFTLSKQVLEHIAINCQVPPWLLSVGPGRWYCIEHAHWRAGMPILNDMIVILWGTWRECMDTIIKQRNLFFHCVLKRIIKFFLRFPLCASFGEQAHHFQKEIALEQ